MRLTQKIKIPLDGFVARRSGRTSQKKFPNMKLQKLSGPPVNIFMLPKKLVLSISKNLKAYNVLIKKKWIKKHYNKKKEGNHDIRT